MLRIVVVEDDPYYRSYVEGLVRHSGDLRLVRAFDCAAASLAEAESAVRERRLPEWNMALVSLELGGIGGFACMRSLKALLPELRIAALSSNSGADAVLEAVRNGADGYLLKHTPADRLLVQLRAAGAGGAPLPAEVSSELLRALRHGDSGRADVVEAVSPEDLGLTKREREVLRCLAQGHSYKATARELEIGIETVRTHVRHLYRKLGVHSAAQAVSQAIREKLV